VPEDLLGMFQPERVRAFRSVKGLTFVGLRSVDEPWAVNLLRMDLTRCELGLQVLRAPRAQELSGGRSTVTDLVRAGGPNILAAVNGDFFTPEGLPVGSEIADGDVRRIGSRPALAWRPGSEPWMGTPVLEGDSVLRLGWPMRRETPGRNTQVVGGFPLLLKAGQRVGDLQVGQRPSFAAQRHPRTGVGFDPVHRVLWLVEVDGRRSGHSAGMTLPELTLLLESLGATEAVNLDGGGSSVMVVGGLAVSRPSDPEGQRPVVNALAVLRRPDLCRISG
jgi:hypothetical protein